MQKRPLVSIIIPTRNSERTIARCLKNIKRQSYKNFEIIIVDNNSTDNTKKIAMEFTDKIFTYGPERGAQVNFGIKKAKGKYIYYTGADLNRSTNLITEAVLKCEKEKCDAIYMNVLTRLKNPNIWQKVRSLERKLYFKEPGMSAARFYKKNIFLKLSGYDEKLGGISDDLEFQHRLNINNYKTCFINCSEYNLDEYDSIGIIVKRSLYYGWLLKKYMEKFPKKTKKQYGLIRPEFIKHKNLLLKDKFVFIIFIIYKLLQYFFGATGLYLSKLSGNNKIIERYLFDLNYSRK